jgi:hypothetical protein
VAAVNTSGVLKDVGDPQARRSDDFYVTPAWQTVAMARYVNIPKLCSVYEPCVGDGAIVRAMQRVRPKLHWFTSDIVAREPFAPTFLADATMRDSWTWVCGQKGKPTLTITNPPFNQAFEILKHAHKWSIWGAVMLLRLSFLEPTDERGAWLAAHPPQQVIVLPRTDYRGSGSTDSVTSAWMYWTAHDTPVKRGGIHIVTKAERDAIIASLAVSSEGGA